jgi:propanol-preferring alcohol dehydrogenase
LDRQSNFNVDTGDLKKKLCLSLGAEKWVYFRESKDLIKDIIAATDGLGPEAAIIAAGDVRRLVIHLVSKDLLDL